MNLCRASAAMLAAAIVGLGRPASLIAADGPRPAARGSAEYNEAVDRANRDYEAANRRCEVLAIEERKLCRRDSTLARRAAIAEALARSSRR